VPFHARFKIDHQEYVRAGGEQAQIPPIASARWIGLVVGVIDQFGRLTRPEYHGIERIPDEPVMLVGNHTIYGVLDVPFLMAGVWKHRGVAVRGLGHHSHWAVPVWRELLERFGAVRGTPANTAELMRRGETILEYPGGADEVNKLRDQKYRLIWKNRTGFARLAIEHGYPIVPFAAVGAEEMLDVVADRNGRVYGPLVRLVDRVTGLTLPSLVRGIGPTPVPRPKQLHFWFGEPIDSARFAAKGSAGPRLLRDEAKRRVEQGIALMLEMREHAD
jgi:1-acyl-sn-glycerol-3-phosphate acyltransferase